MMEEIRYSLHEVKIPELKNELTFRFSRCKVIFSKNAGFDFDEELLIINSMKKLFSYDSFDLFLAKNQAVVLPDDLKAPDCQIFRRSVAVFFHYMVEMITKPAMKHLLHLCTAGELYYAFITVFKSKFLSRHHLKQLKGQFEKDVIRNDVYEVWIQFIKRDYVFRFRIEAQYIDD